ncbi:MAG TPA: S8 family serine peptidase [Asanoa sp.]
MAEQPPRPLSRPHPAPPGASRPEPAPPGPPPTAIGTLPPPIPPPAPPTRPGSNPWAVVAAVLVALWAVGVTVVLQAVGWFVDQILIVGGVDGPAWRWPLIALLGLLAVAPAALLASIPRSAAVRAAGQAWLVAGLALVALTALRALPILDNELYLLILAVLCAVAALVLGRGRGARPARPSAGATWLAVAAGLVLLLPWLRVGALGGAVETLLAVAAAAAVGRLAAAILGPSLWAPYARLSRPELVIVGGLVAGVALTLLGAGVGQSGAQLATLVALPSIGFALAALLTQSARPARGDGAYLRPGAAGQAPPVAWLVALGVLGPLAFVDPEEVTLVLLGRDTPFWTAVAAAVALGLALVVGVAYGLVLARRTLHAWLCAALAGIVLLAGAGVYIGLGRPGRDGDRLFVIMSSQADLSNLPAGTGRAGKLARARAVYQRLVEHARQSQRGIGEELDRLHLGYTPYYLVNALEVDGGEAVRVLLDRRDDVQRILVSQRVRPLPEPPGQTRGGDAAPTSPEWNITHIGADRVWSQIGVTGAGVVVGTSDSGVDGAHPALAAGFRGGDDSWYDPWNGSATPTDTGFHGTHTLGSAVGRDDIGVAPGAQWMGCVNLGRNMGNPAHYLDCLQFMLAPFPRGGDPFTAGNPDRAPDVLTNSWGCPPIEGCDLGSLRPAVDAITAAGLFFVTAAGNTGDLCGSIDDPPAPYASAVTVGAIDDTDTLTRFSSRGPTPDGLTKPDVVAPGADVLSAMPGGGYARESGTSMATPHVAGVVALMWSANPALVGDVARTRTILRDTARAARTGTGNDQQRSCGSAEDLIGAGQVDAYAAVRAARAAG